MNLKAGQPVCRPVKSRLFGTEEPDLHETPVIIDPFHDKCTVTGSDTPPAIVDEYVERTPSRILEF